MSYQGIVVALRIGRGGLMTDENQSDIPDTHLIGAKNIQLQNGIIEKERGSRVWNLTAFSYGISALIDWFPTQDLQRFYAVTKDGKIWKCPDRETRTEITAVSPAPATLSPANQVFFASGGEEAPGNERKLFVYSGNAPIQVITGDGTTRENLANPSADWTSSNYPRFGLIHRNRHWILGGDPHRIYASDDDDHEQFASGGLQFSIYPGEGERLLGAFVYKKRLIVGKYPKGMYMLNDTDASSANWYFERISGEFGLASPQSALEILDDLLVANSKGTITSLAATDRFGDVESGDIFKILKVENYFRTLMANSGLEDRRCIYLSERKIAYFAFRSVLGTSNDSLFKLDFSGQKPEISWIDKDQVNCFALRKTTGGNLPFYGAEDGFIYEMQTVNREQLTVYPPVAPVAALGAAGGIAAGVYRYKYMWLGSPGSRSGYTMLSGPSNPVTIVTPAVAGTISINAPFPLDASAYAPFFERRFYRSKNGGAYVYAFSNYGSTPATDTVVIDSTVTADGAVAEPTVTTLSDAYSMEFQTPHCDFSHVDPQLSGTRKLFDFIEFEFYPTGSHELTFEYYIDGVYRESKSFLLQGRAAVLDDFELDTDRVIGNVPMRVIKKISGAGNTFSVRVTQAGRNENARICAIRVFFRASNKDQKTSTGRTA